MSITNIQHKVKKSNNEPSGKILSFKCASLLFTAFCFRSMFSVTEKATHGHGEKFQKYKKTQSKTQKFSSFYFLHQFFWLYRIYVLPGIHFSLSLFHLDNCTYFFNHQKFTYSFVNWVFYLRILETFSCVSYWIIFYGHYSFARMYNNAFN